MWRSLRNALAFAFAAGLVAAILWTPAPSTALNGGIDGYKVLVDQLLVRQRIVRTTDAVAQLAGGAPRPLTPVVAVDERRIGEPDLAMFGAENIRAFINQSAIRGDIARNALDLWQIDNSLIAMRGQSGQFLSPFAFTDWTGQLLFSGAAPAGRWAMRVGGGAWKPVSALIQSEEGGWRASQCRQTGCIELSRGDGTQHYVRLVGASWADAHPTYCGDARPVPAGTDTRGICLALGDAGPSQLQLIYLTASAAISADSDAPTGYRLAALAGSVRAAKSGWVRNGCQGNCAMERNAPITTTLDRELTVFAQDALDGMYDDKARPLVRPAGITIIDAKTGAIVALAGRNRRAEGNAGALPAEGDVNFLDLPIGSVAKPLIASAIFLDRSRKYGAAHWDGLKVNQQNAGKGITQLLGVPLDSRLDAPKEGSDEWIDVATFVRLSSNYYASALMLLACTSERGSPANWQGAAWVQGAERAVPCTRDAAPTHFTLPWLNAFADIYGPIEQPELSLWGRDDNSFMPNPANFAWLHKDDDNRLVPRARLASFRGNLIPLILGGQDYQWNGVLVAQSFARLVTGKRVSASLVPRQFEPGNMDRGNWDGLSRGLFEVATNGTAAELSTNVAGFRFYAKTGTPEVEVTAGDLPAENARIRNNYAAVRALIPAGRNLENSRGWTSFERSNVRYRMFDGRVVSAASLNVANFYAKTFVFAICLPDAQHGCAGRQFVGFITTQDPKSEGENLALDIARRLLRPDGELIAAVRG